MAYRIVYGGAWRFVAVALISVAVVMLTILLAIKYALRLLPPWVLDGAAWVIGL